MASELFEDDQFKFNHVTLQKKTSPEWRPENPIVKSELILIKKFIKN